MKTILTFVGGGDRDPVILQTALAAAMPLSAHLDCLHLNVPATQAARYARTEFASGAALQNAFDRLETNAKTFSEVAAEHVRTFCANARIGLGHTPAGTGGVTASVREEAGNDLEQLVSHVRNSDLVVLGRARQKQGLAPETLEHLALHGERPILAAATLAPQTLTESILVCWNETGGAARAVTAAMPLLAKAKRIVFLSVTENAEAVTDVLNGVARPLADKGVATEVLVIPASRRKLPMTLAAAAEECGADLVVVGAYGRSRMRELVFGSHTEALLDGIDLPILLMH